MKRLIHPLALLALPLLLLAPSAQADTIVIPDDFPTIQEGITAAGEGDEIVIKAGTYAEELVVSGKPGLVIRGQGKVFLRPASFGLTTALSIDSSDGVTVQGLTFEFAGVGLGVTNLAGIQIRQCNFSRCGVGNQLTACGLSSVSGAIVVEDCFFDHCAGPALRISNILGEIATTSVTNNVFETLEDGITLNGLAQAHVSGNVVRCLGYDRIPVDGSGNFSANLLLSDCTTENVVVEKNRFEGGRGIKFVECTGTVVAGNRIDDPSQTGILVDDSLAVRVTGNTITNAGLRGIYVRDSSGTLVVDNVVKKSRQHGIWISGNTVCKGNRVEQCRADAVFIGGNGSSFVENVITKSGRIGLTLQAGAAGNTLVGNVITGSRIFDLRDLSGEENLFVSNTIGTTAP